MLVELLGQIQTTKPTAPQQPGYIMVVWIVALIAIFWFLLIRPKQKEQKQKERMLGGIKKYDKVMTIGGMIGTVMEVRDEEIILKVDDNANTRIKFTRGAIQRILSSAEADKSS
ncbi:MAG: preprotein translocase subunit YajC [Phycisphaerae bacterium]